MKITIENLSDHINEIIANHENDKICSHDKMTRERDAWKWAEDNALI